MTSCRCRRAGQLPNDVTYPIWTGAGELGGRVKAGNRRVAALQGVLRQGASRLLRGGPSGRFRPPVDLRKLRKADADILRAPSRTSTSATSRRVACRFAPRGTPEGAPKHP